MKKQKKKEKNEEKAALKEERGTKEEGELEPVQGTKREKEIEEGEKKGAEKEEPSVDAEPNTDEPTTADDVALELGLVPLVTPSDEPISAPEAHVESVAETETETDAAPEKNEKPIWPYPPTPPPGKKQDVDVPSSASDDFGFVIIPPTVPAPAPPAAPATPASSDSASLTSTKRVLTSTPTPLKSPTPLSPSPFLSRTPMVRIGSQDEEGELTTPNERSLVGVRVSANLDDGFARMSLNRLEKNNAHEGWDAYNHVERFGAKGGYEDEPVVEGWCCEYCTLVNEKVHGLVCEACGKARKEERKAGMKTVEDAKVSGVGWEFLSS